MCHTARLSGCVQQIIVIPEYNVEKGMYRAAHMGL